MPKRSNTNSGAKKTSEYNTKNKIDCISRRLNFCDNGFLESGSKLNSGNKKAANNFLEIFSPQNKKSQIDKDYCEGEEESFGNYEMELNSESWDNDNDDNIDTDISKSFKFSSKTLEILEELKLNKISASATQKAKNKINVNEIQDKNSKIN